MRGDGLLDRSAAICPEHFLVIGISVGDGVSAYGSVNRAAGVVREKRCFRRGPICFQVDRHRERHSLSPVSQPGMAAPGPGRAGVHTPLNWTGSICRGLGRPALGKGFTIE
ncbi:hypothetical protein DPEC_G00339390 [Dallia pectoralis]|uniref:Uncharacterized protein n=1 Tax=Dallia pectoralis TaxID=75939 RepID=A0ACC2F4X3_DALPE|nr:hypothetical protein DPEC_G00339390 [Dallia pectoralis]